MPNKKVVLPAVAATVLVLMLWLAFRDSSVDAPAAPRPLASGARMSASVPDLDPAPGPATSPAHSTGAPPPPRTGASAPSANR